MKITQGLVGVYALIGLIFGVYQHVGSTAHRLTATDFGTHIAHALLWPAFMFPSFGKFLGGVVVLLVIGGWVAYKAKS